MASVLRIHEKFCSEPTNTNDRKMATPQLWQSGQTNDQDSPAKWPSFSTALLEKVVPWATQID